MILESSGVQLSAVIIPLQLYQHIRIVNTNYRTLLDKLKLV